MAVTWGDVYRRYLDAQIDAIEGLIPPEYGPDRSDLDRILFSAGIDPRRLRPHRLWTHHCHEERLDDD